METGLSEFYGTSFCLRGPSNLRLVGEENEKVDIVPKVRAWGPARNLL